MADLLYSHADRRQLAAQHLIQETRPMPTYAADTSTTKSTTIAELERLLGKYGATTFFSGTDEWDNAFIAFKYAGLNILMRVKLPEANEKRFTHSEGGRPRNTDKVHAEHQTAVRATWRGLLLLVKAKLVAVDQGFTTIEQEFLPHIILPGGATFGDTVMPQIREAYRTGQVPPLLPSPGRPAIEGGPR